MYEKQYVKTKTLFKTHWVSVIKCAYVQMCACNLHFYISFLLFYYCKNEIFTSQINNDSPNNFHTKMYSKLWKKLKPHV